MVLSLANVWIVALAGGCTSRGFITNTDTVYMVPLARLPGEHTGMVRNREAVFQYA